MIVSSLAACGSDESGDGGPSNPRVGLILPDAKSSQRWAKEPRYFRAAFAALGVPVEIQNAGGDPANFVRIGEEMINNGVKVLIIANLDSISGKAVLNRAAENDIPTIDYDRLTLNGGADYYVSFDNERIGELQGYGLTKCLRVNNAVNPMVASLNGSPTDGNATILKEGYDFVLQSRFDNGEYRRGPDQFVPDWDAAQAQQVFEQMFKQQPKINAVLAANDDIAGAVIKVLKKNKLNGKVPVTGQDATLEGLRNVLSGDQCLTIYKRVEPEAYTAASLAAKLFKGETPKVGAKLQDPESGEFIPFASIPPVPIEAEQVKDVVAEGVISKKELCTGVYVALCKEYGVE
ncbi:sugar ABC transporter substrate-binding protein [Paractinoplanes rishiriensis]|nr:substrate-binding domain-containing protein [Actinoplanes rishiriensis]